jgi:hypothetical protein
MSIVSVEGSTPVRTRWEARSYNSQCVEEQHTAMGKQNFAWMRCVTPADQPSVHRPLADQCRLVVVGVA